MLSSYQRLLNTRNTVFDSRGLFNSIQSSQREWKKNLSKYAFSGDPYSSLVSLVELEMSIVHQFPAAHWSAFLGSGGTNFLNYSLSMKLVQESVIGMGKNI